MFNADLMTTLQRIRSNEAKLAEIAQRRKELELEAKKRVLPEEDSSPGSAKKAKVERVFKWKNLSKPKAEVEVKFEVLALEVLQLDFTSNTNKPVDLSKAKLSYSTRNDHAMLLAGGDAFGNVLLWDVLKDFALAKTIVLREGGNTNHVKHLEFALDLFKQNDKGEDTDARVEDVPYMVATVGHDLFIIDLVHLEVLYTKEDTFRSEVQAIVPVVSEEKVVCATLEQAISCYCGKTWQSLFTLVGHSESVLCLCYVPADPKRPNSYRILSGSDDATIRVWDIAPCGPKAEAKRAEVQEKRIAEGKGKEKEKVGKGGSDTEEEDEDGQGHGVVELDACEKVLTVHSEFVSTICCVAARDAPSDETLILTGSGDFKICVLNRNFECIHVLGNDKFAKSIIYVQPWFFLVYQTSLEDDEDMSFLQTFDTGSQPDPLKWKTSKTHHRLMRESKALAQGIDMQVLMPKPSTTQAQAQAPAQAQAQAQAAAKAPKVFPFVATSARHKPPEPKQPVVKAVSPPESKTPTIPPVAQEIAPKIPSSPPPLGSSAVGSALGSPAPTAAASGLGLSSMPFSKPKPSPSQSPSIANSIEKAKKAEGVEGSDVSNPVSISASSKSYSGDALAKKFAANILLIPDISPDMQRLLRCCVKLREE